MSEKTFYNNSILSVTSSGLRFFSNGEQAFIPLSNIANASVGYHERPICYTALVWYVLTIGMAVLCVLGSLSQFTEGFGEGLVALFTTSILTVLFCGTGYLMRKKEIDRNNNRFSYYLSISLNDGDSGNIPCNNESEAVDIYNAIIEATNNLNNPSVPELSQQVVVNNYVNNNGEQLVDNTQKPDITLEDSKPIEQPVKVSKASDFKKVLLKAAVQHGGRLSVTDAVLEVDDLSFEDAKEVLDSMTESGYVYVDNNPETGVIEYVFKEIFQEEVSLDKN